MRFNESFLRDCADIQTGPFGSQLHKEDYVSVGTPIVTVEHLGNKEFTEQNLPMVSDEDKKRLSKYVLETGDIVFSRVGSVDRCSFVDEAHNGWMFSGRCLRVRPKANIDPLYLYYYFCLESTKQFIRNIAVGATMPSINTKLLGEVEIKYPEIEIQRRIVSILSDLDDKIAINQKINENLEQQAQAVYRRMFGKLDSCETCSMLSDICHYSKEKVEVSTLNKNKYYSTENMLPEKMGAIEAASLPSATQTTACHMGDTLVSNIRPYFKKIVFCQEDCGCSTDVLCFVPAYEKYSAYLFNTLYADEFFDFMMAGAKGTKMPRGDKKQIMTYPVMVPSDEELMAFNSIAEPILKQIYFNRIENKKLSALRDTLLPRLMSGKIDVEGIEL